MQEAALSSSYPEEVVLVMESIKDCLEEDGFFADIEVTSELGRQAFDAVAGPVFLQQWIDNGEVNIDADQLFDLMKKTVVESCLFSLKNKGMIDSIDDEGKEVFFLTTKGKQTIG
jgi:hypothetical protein